jgi:hypothetical protein
VGWCWQGAEAAVVIITEEAFARLRPPASIDKAAEEQVKLDFLKEQLEEKLGLVGFVCTVFNSVMAVVKT